MIYLSPLGTYWNEYSTILNSPEFGNPFISLMKCGESLINFAGDSENYLNPNAIASLATDTDHSAWKTFVVICSAPK